MIKKGKFRNIFGIKNFDLDFSLKHTYGDGQSEQVINYDGNSVMLNPTILAKNAAGKTSLIKAIDFGLRFSNKETFIKTLSHYKFNIVSKEMNRMLSHVEGGRLTDDFNDGPLAMNFSSKKLIRDIFAEVSYAGSETSEIEIETIDNKNIRLEITADSFFIRMNGTVISLENVLAKINIKDLENKLPRQVKEEIDAQANAIANKLDFFQDSVNFTSLFRDAKSVIELNELRIKDRTNMYLDGIINEIGFDSANVLVRKLDSNINKMTYDQESKTFNIFLKGLEASISPKNLSFGTQKVIEIFYKSIKHFKNGGIIMIDEIENGLHLSLIKLIIALFEDEEINVAKAQLLLTTHNPLLVENKLINGSNILMYEGESFVNVKNIKLNNGQTPRKYDREKMIKAKNYYNDLFWEDNSLESKSTISNIGINQVIDAVQNGVTWLRK